MYVDKVNGKLVFNIDCHSHEQKLYSQIAGCQYNRLSIMLRIFVKIERLTNSSTKTETGMLSNYHIKTLMLWACELKTNKWWTVKGNVVEICVELLQVLSVWLQEARCKHYFINNCNLLHSPDCATATICQWRKNGWLNGL